MSPSSRRTVGWILTCVFAVALLMGPGPGMLLINRPQPLWGLPALYAWGLLWYGVEVLVVVLAFLLVWTQDDGEPDQRS